MSSRIGSVVRPVVQSQVIAKLVSEQRPREKKNELEEDEGDNQRGGVNSVIRVTAR